MKIVEHKLAEAFSVSVPGDVQLGRLILLGAQFLSHFPDLPLFISSVLLNDCCNLIALFVDKNRVVLNI